MLLSHLPVELLAQILDGAHSWVAVELWKTGNGILRQKLAHGGIQVVDLRGHSGFTTGTWPRCLKEFRLRKLSVKSNCELLPLPSLRNELMGLQSTLVELKLAVPGGVEVFSDDEESSQAEDASAVLESKARDGKTLQDVFSSLQVLKLTRIASVLVGLSTTDGPRVSKLPRSVKRLSLLKVSFVDWDQLPLQLESLKFDSWISREDAFKALSVVPMKFDAANSRFEDLFNEWTPPCPNLPQFTHLHLRYPIRFGPNVTWLPSGLKEAILDAEPSLLPVPLPPLLERLEINARLNENWINVLPPSLTHLAMNSYPSLSWSALNTTSHWPSLLASLSLQWGEFALQHLHLLPRTLKTLDLREPNTNTTLPTESTEQLLSHGVASITGPDASAWAHAKQALLSYSLKRGGIDSSFVRAYIAKVEAGGLLGLPLHLTRLSIIYYAGLSDWELVLPPELRKLSTSVINDLNFLDLLPPSLTALKLLRDNNALETFSKQDDDGKHLPHFLAMPYMRSITIDTTQTSRLERLIPLLPRSLLKLVAASRNLASLDSMVLQSLPPHLTALRLNCNAIASPLPWLPLLPRSLLHLTLFVQLPAIKADELIGLPPKLEYFHGRISNLNLDSVLLLPRSLRVFSPDKSSSNATTDHFLASQGWQALHRMAVPFWRIFHRPRSELYGIMQLFAEDSPIFKG